MSNIIFCHYNDDPSKEIFEVLGFVQMNHARPFTTRAIVASKDGKLSEPALEQITVHNLNFNKG